MLGTKDFSVTVNDREFLFRDLAGSSSVPVIVSELGKDAYGLRDIPFAPGDVVLDIGANVGIISIILAAFRPQVTVYAYEPVPENFANLRHNIAAAGLEHRIIAHNLAVTGDGGHIEMVVDPENTGSSRAFFSRSEMTENRRVRVEATTLDEIFARYGIQRCKLLKMDAEGAEYGILTSTTMLDRIDFLAAEFHGSPELTRQHLTMKALYDHVSSIIPPGQLRISGVFAQPTPTGTHYLVEPDLGRPQACHRS
jgi:FkbM family methyltransferase